jgi:hypothetical protein
LINGYGWPFTQRTGEKLTFDTCFKLPMLATCLGDAEAQSFFVGVTQQNKRSALGAFGSLQQPMRQVVGGGEVNRLILDGSSHGVPLKRLDLNLQTIYRLKFGIFLNSNQHGCCFFIQ